MWLEYVKKYREENGNTPLKTIAEDYRAKGFGKPKVEKPPALKASELRVKLIQLGYDLSKPTETGKKSLKMKEMKAILTAHGKEKIEVVEPEAPPLPKVKTVRKPKVIQEEPVNMGEEVLQPPQEKKTKKNKSIK